MNLSSPRAVVMPPPTMALRTEEESDEEKKGRRIVVGIADVRAQIVWKGCAESIALGVLAEWTPTTKNDRVPTGWTPPRCATQGKAAPPHRNRILGALNFAVNS